MTKEDSFQIAVMNYLRLQYPKVLAYHVPNGGSRNAIEGGKLKLMGVKKGIPDVTIVKCVALMEFEPKIEMKFYNGLAIELKIKPNKPTKEQLQVLEHFEVEGWKTAVCYSFDDAKEIIDNYLNQKP